MELESKKLDGVERYEAIFPSNITTDEVMAFNKKELDM